MASESGSSRALPVAGDAKVDWSFHDAGQLDAVVELSLFATVSLGGFPIGLNEVIVNGSPHGFTSNHNEVPRLHEADRGTMMRGIDQPAQYVIGNRCRQEMGSDIAALVDGAINSPTFGT